MGLAIDRDRFEEHEYARFSDRLGENLDALRELLNQPDFGVGAPSLGAELEMSIIDSRGRALGVNRKVLARVLDSHLQLELDRFNLEYNLTPVVAAGRPFAAIEAELTAAIGALDKSAAELGGRVAPIGILPTLTLDQLQNSAMTDLPRYRALDAGLQRIRHNSPFAVEIDGDEPLSASCDHVTLEGANTSFQVHLRIDPADFADTFNAAQLTTPLVVAVSANSPTFLGHCLWDETRVALFKQAVDSRAPHATDWRRAARVPFGHGWNRDGAYELFAEAVALHPPLMPVCAETSPQAAVEGGRMPELAELRLHQGTVWQWNRAIYDPNAGGHVRIEMRSLPGGPTPLDMAANAALHIGLAAGMRDRMREIMARMPFRYAEYNFYRAAQKGLDASLLWPAARPPSPGEVPVRRLLADHLQVARDGLTGLGVDGVESDRLLAVIEDRLRTGMTPARWQRRVLKALDARMGREQALAAMLERYLAEAATGRPASQWARPG